MDTLTLVLFLVIAVLVSAVIDQIVRRVSLPLIQVVMGIVIALFASGNVSVNLQPDLFLVLFIAPLLYIEAKDADKASLWRNLKPILSLAIGLVVLSTLIIGFILNLVYPSIPLAAAFALAAALGPTDAVAVTSLSKQTKLPARVWGILKGELLLNDASGIVSFQFAIAAVITGSFSLLNAGMDFALEFVGGLVFGLVLGYVANFVLRWIRKIGVESTTFHVIFEVCIPFIVYLAANSLHVSGIIAVVTAGLINVIAPRTVSPSIAHMNIVSSNVWQVISFTLNGIVFVMLGTQLPTAMSYAWSDDTISNIFLIGLVLGITITMYLVRFVWCLFMELVRVKRPSKKDRDRGEEPRKFTLSNAKQALILTLCGAKGTITLSILFTIPFSLSSGQAFPERNLILFLGCGVILCTLLVATYLVPLVSPRPAKKQTEIEARQNYFEVLADILRNVIEELMAQSDKSNRRATRRVVKIYEDRLENTKVEADLHDSSLRDLRLTVLGWEEEFVLQSIDSKEVARDIGYDYLGRVERMAMYVKHGNNRSLARRLVIAIKIAFAHLTLVISRKLPEFQKRQLEARDFQIKVNEYILDKLHDLISHDDVQTEDASTLIMEYESAMAALKRNSPSITTTFRIADDADDIRRLAYQLELEQIQKAYEQERISRHEAADMRDNVYMMQMDLDDTL